MRTNGCVAAVLLGMAAAAGCATAWGAEGKSPRSEILFDGDWRFLKGDCVKGEAVGFEDAGWRKLNLPHDWSIEGPFDEHAASTGAGAFLPDGVGWYRKHFAMPADAEGKKIFVDFDGVMANSDVWVNGFHLGKRPYGYVGFRYELTGHVKAGGENVIAVRADNAQEPASRYYSGAGIYRHVHLVVSDAVHIEKDGTFVTTPEIAAGRATVHVQNTVVNQSNAAKDVSVKVTLLDPAGKTAGSGESGAKSVPAGGSAVFEQDISVAPELWDLEHPNLYKAVSDVRGGGAAIDEGTVSFGILEAEFKAESGFWLNGKNFKLKGVCLHQESGGLGVAVPMAAYVHRLEALKALGCNAIRTAHNPPSPEFLAACDQTGFLVMDEMFDCWTVAKKPFDYHLYFKEWSLIDERDTVRRDRNHPSIILYSVGNEIHDTPNAAVAIPILKSLVATAHENDPTRPVTQALFRPNTSHDYTNGLADLLDVIGTNYRDNELIAAQAAKPTRKIVGTENGPGMPAWAAVRDHAGYSGQFLWTGADYLGESLRWPNVQHESGLVDITDAVHPIGYQRKSWWSDKPMVAIVRDEGAVRTGNQAGEPQTRVRQKLDWTPMNLAPHSENVLVYSNCKSVELFLNGKSLGAKEAPENEASRAWKVDFAPGTLKAVAKDDGGRAIETELRTAGKPAKIVVTSDRQGVSPSWEDVAFVTATVVDGNGVVVPNASDLVTFKVSGAGAVAVAESANPDGHDAFLANETHAFMGRCVAIVRATAGTGEMEISASGAGLAAGSIKLKVRE